MRPAGSAVVAGRAGARLRGISRPVLRFPTPPRPTVSVFADTVVGCDYELVVDLERGVLLRFVESLGDEQLKVASVVEIGFDEALPDELFVPPGSGELPAVKESPPPTPGQEQRVEAAEAASLVPFTFLFPTRVPEGATPSATYYPPEADAAPAAVTLHYRFPAATHRLELRQRAAGNGGSGWWRPVMRGAQRFLVSLEAHPWPSVRFERHGTEVVIDSDLELQTVLEIGASCAPAD